MKLNSLCQGRLRVWWVSHNHRPVLAATFIAAISILVFYYESAISKERAERAIVSELLAAEQTARGFQKTMFLIEASTIPQARDKLARVAGELDAARGGMK